MNRKFKIFMLNIIVVLVLIFANFSHSDAATKSWYAGDLFLFSHSTYYYVNTTNADFVVSNILEVSVKEEGTYNITRVDLSDNTYASIFTGSAGSGPNILNYFGWEEFTTYRLDLNNFFTITYDWDYGHNKTVLTYFDFGLIENWPFIEPQWDRINLFMSEMFNESEIVDTVVDPYEPLIHNITFGDFMSSVESFSIMNKNTLAEAELQFKNNTRKWTFEFDLSNVLMDSVYNFTLGYNVYYPYQSIVYNFEYEYTEGGILNRVYRSTTMDLEIEDRLLQAFLEQKLVLGNFKSLEANYPYFMVLPVIFLVTFAIRKTKSKNNRRIK